MAPLVCTINKLVEDGCRVAILEPASDSARALFESHGWMQGIVGEEAPPIRIGATHVPLTRYENGEELNELVSRTLRLAAESDVFPPGVLQGLEWTLNEMADNVLAHAEAAGWLQVVSYPTNKRLEVAVVDSGRGVLASIREAYPDTASDLDALNLAIQQGITRNRELNQGNGLSGTLRIASSANGYANLHSGNGELRLFPDGDLKSGNAPNHPGTLVTLTLPTDKPIDVTESLWGHTPVPAFEMDYLGEAGVEFVVRHEATNFGNRQTGERLRNKVRNLMEIYPDDAIVLDFTDVDVVSASFADELVAKLVKELGPTRFYGRFRLRNVSGFVATTIDNVIAQRLAI